nr:hypothetical protein [Tanacetum cinerariifolium]
MDVPPRTSNPIPLQSHTSLDITLSLSPITPLDHILDTPSPPSPQPPPQPPLMCRLIYFNTFDYHEVCTAKVDDVSLVDGVFNGAFGGDGEEDFVMGEGVVVSSSSLVRSTKSCQGGMMVSLIFLEGFIEED